MPFTPTADGVRLRVRLTPKGARDAIQGVKAAADGGRELAVSVTAVPEKGRANAALIALLAKVWRLPKRDITLISGDTDRHKVLLIRGGDDLASRLTQAIEEI